MGKLIAVLLAGLPLGAFAADSGERTHPLDANPECMSRDSSGDKCVIKNGEPRRRHQAVPPAAISAPQPAPPKRQPPDDRPLPVTR